MILNTIISIFKYCYHYETYCNTFVTIIITTLYSYIYRYNYTDSIIRIIPKNTEMNNHTVYSLHNYTIINTILAYSNFLSVYHSYLLLKQ